MVIYRIKNPLLSLPSQISFLFRGTNYETPLPSLPLGFYNQTNKAWFSHVAKIPDDRRFYFLPNIPDFADISDNRQKSVPIWGTGAQQFRGLVMSEIHRRRPRG